MNINGFDENSRKIDEEMFWSPKQLSALPGVFGRRRPFLVVSAVLAPLTITAAFLPPTSSPVASGVWWGVMHVIYNVRAAPAARRRGG